jgi:hypothetical protein
MHYKTSTGEQNRTSKTHTFSTTHLGNTGEEDQSDKELQALQKNNNNNKGTSIMSSLWKYFVNTFNRRSKAL